MSYAAQTPQRLLPGAYVQTPAASRYQPGFQRQSSFRGGGSSTQLQNVPQQGQTGQEQLQRQPQEVRRSVVETLSPIDRAAKTINETLNQELKYPDLDTYVGQGISSEYDLSSQPGWAPFQKVKMYPIPDKIFNQYNHALVSTMMGLFAEINHAWVAIDNACYLWDYTLPSPGLLGVEQQHGSITAAGLVTPRAGVFIPAVARLLVVATTAEIVLVGISLGGDAPGQSISLYQTKMSIPIKGMDVNIIAGSATTGRVFFSGRVDNDVYEITYQQEEKWFQSRCGRINHTSRGLSALTPSFSFGPKPRHEYTIQMIIDDSRNLLYTLSSVSTIRVFHMKPNMVLDLVITQSLNKTLNEIGHMLSTASELISRDMQIVSINSIPAQESSKLHLMVMTSTGCRAFMSATSSYGYVSSNSSSVPTSMQVHHVKFPPPELNKPSSQQPPASQMPNPTAHQGVNTSSKSLAPMRLASRYSPGYCFCFVSRDAKVQVDTMFISAPDTGRIGRPQEVSNLSRFCELGFWMNLNSRAEDIGLVTAPSAASRTPTGYGNELAVQYDKPTAEVAVLTNTGVHTLRRRRLVDMFASAIQAGGGDEGLEGEVKKFLRLYGRGETAAMALAVACGQGLDVTAESRVANVTDPEVLERARKAFIEFGGKPQLNENSLMDQSIPAIDLVRPSPRHYGLALYMSRLVRSIWNAPIAQESVTPTGGLAVLPTVTLQKLRDVQRDLTKLDEFLSANKTFIDGLAGPEALGRVSTKQDEIALQAEHRALHSLVTLISNIIEGISFVLTLFDERIEEIVLSLSDETRQQFRNLTYHGLFCTTNGKELAKELVKAIVNRNIVNGSNVDSVAESLRRRCGSFCSADDVVIFKAQEQLKRATEAGSETEYGRNMLNESLRLFKQVAGNLSMEQLSWAVNQYVSMQFFAGAIQLSLSVAQESDRGNRALTWIQDGRPEQDSRAPIFGYRKKCYDLVHQVITSLDQAATQNPEVVEGQYTISVKRRAEAYEVIDTSEDEVFQTDLYDWYLSQGQADRLLEIHSQFVIAYLRRKSLEDITHADLLWRYYSQANRPFDAASVQLELAKSGFELTLDRRVEYLSRAKANASPSSIGVARQNRQPLLHEISELLEITNIQSDLVQKIKADPRASSDRRKELLNTLDGQILNLNILYNTYCAVAGYHDLNLIIYQAADYRNPTDIRDTWRNHLESQHEKAVKADTSLPYEAIAEEVRRLGQRLNLSETHFPVPVLLPLLERYAFEFQRGVGSATWVVDVFLDLGIPAENLFAVLEEMLWSEEAPFTGRNRGIIANHVLYVAQRWFEETSRSGIIFGSEENAEGVLEVLRSLGDRGLEREAAITCEELRVTVDRLVH